MYFIVKQIEKELFSAKFTILNEDNAKIGDIELNGSMGSIEATTKISLQTETIILKYGYKNFKEKIKGTFSKGIFRPYTIFINNKEVGRIGLQQLKKGFLMEIAFKELTLNDLKYESYFYGLGEKGIVHSIYANNIQVAEIHKGNVILDGLYNYEAKCLEEKYYIPTVIQCIYTYLLNDYIPGQKIIKRKGNKKYNN